MDKPIPKTKVCTKCEKRKRMSSFGPSKNGRFGFCSTCRVCYNDYQREYYLKNIDRLRKESCERTKRYYLRNAEVIRKKHVDQYRAHHKKKREYARAYYSQNVEICKAKAREAVINLSNSYVSSLLGMPLEECPPELIEVKRIQLQIKRHLENGN